MKMTRLSVKTLVAAAVLSVLATSAIAQADKAEPWVLKMDRGYAYGKHGELVSYRMGTNNAEWLFRGAKKVPKGTLFFVAHDGQLYMRRGPYLDSDGTFMFGPQQ